MTTLASYSPGHPWRRSGSRESVYSIQGHETDLVRDTSDTEGASDEEGVEYEPASASDDEGGGGRAPDDTSDRSDSDVIVTKVIEVCVADDGGVLLADSEQTALDTSDSELDYHDYWLCANCRTRNNNPIYRYCQKCFEVRKNFFPPRPKRKAKRHPTVPVPHKTLSQDSGVDLSSQRSAGSGAPTHADDLVVKVRSRKRSASSIDHNSKRVRVNSDSRSESDSDILSDNGGAEVLTLQKSLSDPAITIDNNVQSKTDKVKDRDFTDRKDNLCITCCSEPKSGVFVHGRIAHICCCYKCAVRVWRQAKRCPICNSKVSNVLRAVVM